MSTANHQRRSSISTLQPNNVPMFVYLYRIRIAGDAESEAPCLGKRCKEFEDRTVARMKQM